MTLLLRRAVSISCVVLNLAATVAEDHTHLVERSGDVLQIALPASAGAATLALRDFVGTRQFVIALLVSTAASHLLKRVINRRRPDGGRWGFPSAHTSAAFLGSGFVHFRYGWKYAWPLHLAAAFVGYSRVASNKHWPSDVAGGAVLSLAVCWLLVRPRRPKSGSRRRAVVMQIISMAVLLS